MFRLINTHLNKYNKNFALNSQSLYCDQDETVDRRVYLTKLIRSIASELGLSDANKIQVTPLKNLYDVNPTAIPWEFRIEIPPFLFFSFDEVPENLGFSGPNDPTLNNLNKIQKFTDWACEKVGVKSVTVSYIQRDLLKLVLEFMEDPEKAKKAINFVIAHELGHIQHEQKAIRKCF